MTVLLSKIDSIATNVSSLDSKVSVLQYSFDCVLEDMLDPWEKIHSETTNAVKQAEKLNMSPVTNYYGIKSSYCMVLGNCGKKKVACAHIWPKHTHGKGLPSFGLEEKDINCPRNFLRLNKQIEINFYKKRLAFLPDHSNDDNIIILKVFVLDPSLTCITRHLIISFQSPRSLFFD